MACTTDRWIGRHLLGRYRVDALLGIGGMGRVYRGHQFSLARDVALKILDARAIDSDPDLRGRFLRELRVLMALRHPNTVTIFDDGEAEDGSLFAVLELLHGRSLYRVLREEGALEESRALRLLLHVGLALREAHGQGVIHRDVKPSNIFVVGEYVLGDREREYAKLLDFGLAHECRPGRLHSTLTMPGFFLGSPKYAAPEQVRGDPVDARADVYALGVVLYEMLAGRPPFWEPTQLETMMAHVYTRPPPLPSWVRRRTCKLVERCLRKHPDDRFPSVDVLVRALGEHLHESDFTRGRRTSSCHDERLRRAEL